MPATPLRSLVSGVLATVLLCTAGTAAAGGPLFVRSNGLPFVWSTAAPIPYRTDNGPLSTETGEAEARARVIAMFNVWQSVTTANISFNRAGFINSTGAFSDGDVSTIDEYDAVNNNCTSSGQNPVIYDADGSILDELGFDTTSVIGFAGPCTISASQILSGIVVMNGLFDADLTDAQFDAAFVHEIGHFAGLDHSQVNVNCLNGCNTNSPDLTGLPTMFPFLVDESQISPSADDIAWISRLYPAASFATTHGTITGHVYFSDGDSQAQLVNVIARRVNTGASEDRTTAVSNVSGYRFRAFHGNPITDPDASPFGTQSPDDIGLFEIPVPAGNYTIEVETINEEFIDGSSVGGPIRIPMPGSAPPPSGPVAVGAGNTAAGNDVTLIGTPPRFDPFEGP
ncbi:MAG: hypothetical protein WD793_07060 [Steroidobacteraceae bacterium]